ncbi:MAG: trypsin-like peptidase domain-containing protein [Patescibacteria group bacterium]|nr:trypsin-like peptidase domain-containing protein [Patescibacteria group bacterium]
MKKDNIIIAVIGLGFGFLALTQVIELNRLNDAFSATENRQDMLQKQIMSLRQHLVTAAGESEALASRMAEAEQRNREVVRQKSQDELLTAAVAMNTPAVVSVVISKDVPQLEVTYVNPFGDDPFFKDFDFRVPVYRQKGSTLQKVGAGTGFIVSKDGLIVTNRHVVTDQTASYTALLSDGSQQTARVLYRDPNNDLAVIKIDGTNLPTVSLGDSASLKLGQTVSAIGNALGEYDNSVSVGIISGLDRTIEAGGGGTSEQLKGVIQTDAAINPGNSGGPLIDLDGRVIGVSVATVLGSQNISFAIPVNDVKRILDKVATQ